mgnify:CR=1 FL=1|jgi:hypothetical protein
MGNLFGRGKAVQIIESIQSLHNVELTLQALINKYQKQIDEQKEIIKQKMNSKSESIRHVKRILLIRSHQRQLESRMLSLLNKRYTLEALNVTKMHLNAIKMTSNTFKYFLKANDIDKVSDMQETLTGMITDACEINDVISSTDYIEGIDNEEIENEYLKMVEEIQNPGFQESLNVFPSIPSNRPSIDTVGDESIAVDRLLLA